MVRTNSAAVIGDFSSTAIIGQSTNITGTNNGSLTSRIDNLRSPNIMSIKQGAGVSVARRSKGGNAEMEIAPFDGRGQILSQTTRYKKVL